MRHLILSFLLFFVAPVWASLPPVLRLDQSVPALQFPAYVQVMYTDTVGYIGLRVRYQSSAQSTPTNYCIMLRPTASAPPGVPINRWVPANGGISFDPAYAMFMPFWTSACQSN